MAEQRFFSRLTFWVQANRSAWSEIRAKKSWLRSARLAARLRGVDLARRLGVSPARVSMLERDEARGGVTLNMMQKAAQALDCEFVYVLIPKTALSEPVAETAKPKIRVQLAQPECAAEE